MKENIFKQLFNNKYIVAGICATVIIVLFATVVVYGCVLIDNDNILDGVSISNTDLSGKTREDAATIIAQEMQFDENCEIQFSCNDNTFVLVPAQIDLHADSEAAAQQAYDIGHSGNVFVRIWDAYCAKFAGKKLEVKYAVDESMLAAAIEESLGEQVTPATPYSVVVETDALVVQNGTDGKGVVQKDIIQNICDDLSDGKIDNIIQLTISTIPAQPIDFEEFCSEYIREAQDAQYTTSNGEYVFTPEVLGVNFDVDTARKIIEENVSNTQPYRIPAQITVPEVTVEQLQSKFAVDVLGTYTTNYSGSSANRASNVELAASKINGTVLNPGERFSFNGVVGPRTVAAGFKSAHVYVGDKVTDGIGGGICQVSSTLYNAVLLADLKIVKRTNHSMPVAYVPLGRDATVSYGTIDFVFENNKKHPVTISATWASRNLTIAIKGVDESDGVTIEIVTENAGYTAYPTKETVDASLAPGETRVVQNGANGSIYNAYKVYKKDGAVIKREHIARSNYIPVSRIVAVGPAQVQQPSETVSAPEQPPAVQPPVEQPKVEQQPQITPPNQPATSEPEEVQTPQTDPEQPAEPEQTMPDADNTQSNTESAPSQTEQTQPQPTDNLQPVENTSSEPPQQDSQSEIPQNVPVEPVTDIAQ